MKFGSHKSCDTFRIYHLAKERIYSFLSPVFQIDHLQIREETPTATYFNGQIPNANSQEHSAVNRPQIEETAITLDDPESTKQRS